MTELDMPTISFIVLPGKALKDPTAPTVAELDAGLNIAGDVKGIQGGPLATRMDLLVYDDHRVDWPAILTPRRKYWLVEHVAACSIDGVRVDPYLSVKRVLVRRLIHRPPADQEECPDVVIAVVVERRISDATIPDGLE
jgi:hypothetical protein